MDEPLLFQIFQHPADHLARTADDAADFLAGSVGGKRIGVVCGTGANGGDGLVAARFLSNWKAQVQVLLVGRGASMADPDAAAALAAVQRMVIPLALVQTGVQAQREIQTLIGCDLVIDALFGTGLSSLSGAVRDPAATVIDQVNALGLSVLSVDIPSGLDANTGRKIGRAIAARLTVTMGLPKKGFFLEEGPACTGKILVADLGYPRILLNERDGLYLHRKEKPKEEK